VRGGGGCEWGKRRRETFGKKKSYDQLKKKKPCTRSEIQNPEKLEEMNGTRIGVAAKKEHEWDPNHWGAPTTQKNGSNWLTAA